MPLKLNIAMSRKIGEPNYGSRGATVGLEMEVDSNLVNQPRQLHQQIACLFRLAKASVDHQLSYRTPSTNPSAELADAGSGRRPATVKQLRAIRAISDRRNLDLTVELHDRFNVERPEDLSLEQASQLIDAIKPSANGDQST